MCGPTRKTPAQRLRDKFQFRVRKKGKMLMQGPSWITAIGLAAATLTTVAFLPQVVKVWRTRSTRDISFSAFSILFAGAALWLLYGILISDAPLIAGNAIGVMLIGTILLFKLRYG